MPPGEFSSPDLSDWRADDGSVGGSYLPSGFVGQPVGIDQVGDVWIGDSGATTHMTRNADLMYDTKPPSPQRSRIILGDGSIKKVQFVGKIDLVFHSRTDYQVTLHNVSFVPDLGFNLFSFHVVQEKHEIILNKTGAHLLGGRLVFPRRRNGSSLRATRVLPGSQANANNALATFVEPPPHSFDGPPSGPPSPVPYSTVSPPVVHQTSGVSRSCRTSNAGTGFGEESGESASGLSEGVGMAAAVLSPGGLFVNNKKTTVVDINHFHVSLAHAHSSVLKATARQHGIQPVGELAPCSGCSMAKGIRASTPHHTTSRAAAPLDMVHIDTAGPFPESFGGSRYVVMFVDSASRFQRPYGTRDKSASAILGVVQRFVADMGLPRAFRTDNGTEYTNSDFVEYCNSLQIRREITAPYTPQQNAPVESGLSRALKAGHAARLEVVVVVVVVDSHNQRIVLATEETTVTQQVSPRPIKCQSRLWSQRGTKVNGSHHGDNPLLRPTGIQIATKSYAALQAMAPTNIKTVHQTSLLHIESNLDRLGMLSPTHDQRSQQKTGKITLQPVLINKSKFLKATHFVQK